MRVCLRACERQSEGVLTALTMREWAFTSNTVTNHSPIIPLMDAFRDRYSCSLLLIALLVCECVHVIIRAQACAGLGFLVFGVLVYEDELFIDLI